MRVKLGTVDLLIYTAGEKNMTQSNETLVSTKFSRRTFAQMLLGAGALALIERGTIAGVLADSKLSMAWLAAQTASAEGAWTNLKIEGELPADLTGTLFRTAPGQAESYGTRLRHLFDGDAFLSAWRFEGGKVSLNARFLQTPQRAEEARAGQMLYSEFGTPAPRSKVKKMHNGKNQPSVNIVEWRGKLLGLSEGGLPIVINPTNFAYEGETDFAGVVPRNLTFTAHPRFDAATGDMFAYGFLKGEAGTLHVFHIEKTTGKANLLYRVPQTGFYMAHDSLLTENYFILLIPPMKYDMEAMLTGGAETVGDALRYAESEPTRLLAFPRDGKSAPVTMNLPSSIIFHFGNAQEIGDGKISFEMISSDDRRVFEVLNNWKTNRLTNDIALKPQNLRRMTIDLTKRIIVGTTELYEAVEFPRFDARLTAQKSRFLYATENGYLENAAIVRIDLERGKATKINAGRARTFGEPVFAPRRAAPSEENGWLLTQGFDAARNETFVEIRDAQTLEFAARVWASGQHFPLGFHGNFYQTS